MPYDSGMLAAVCREVNEAAGARVDKIYQTGREEIIIVLRGQCGTKRLLINAGSSYPRMCFITEQKRDPETPPNFCMMLRKHIGGAVFNCIEQLGSERAAKLSFTSRDEMGYTCERALIVEIMNKYSNIILTDTTDESYSWGGKIIGAVKTVDISTSRLRQVLPGMKYEAPPPQNKTDIITVTREEFYESARQSFDMMVRDFLLRTYTGISPLLARELAYISSGGDVDALLGASKADVLWQEFSDVIDIIRGIKEPMPCVICDSHKRPLEFSFRNIGQYGAEYEVKEFSSPSLAVEFFYSERARVDDAAQRGRELNKIMNNAYRRVERKLEALAEDANRSAEGEKYKRWADAITAGIHTLVRGMTEAELVDYSSADCPVINVPLDARLSPSQNAQRYYKLYAKCKTARVMIAEQIEKAKAELRYIESVIDAISRAESDADIAELRHELEAGGYIKSASRSTRSANAKHKKTSRESDAFARYETTNGYVVLCGKNNMQNDLLTMKTASRGDYWFHVKNAVGSHVILVRGGREEPSEVDFTDAAMIAAYNSSLCGGESVAVDYTLVKNIRKPPGSRPGFVTYKTNWTAYVTPDPEHVRAMRRR